jgi:hypothetical protein
VSGKSEMIRTNWIRRKDAAPSFSIILPILPRRKNVTKCAFVSFAVHFRWLTAGKRFFATSDFLKRGKAKFFRNM